MNIKELVKDNTVKFVRFREGNFIYSIKYANGELEFPVPLSDIGNATLLAEDKAILFLRYIRQHLGTLY
jgi:hypothetical protein